MARRKTILLSFLLIASFLVMVIGYLRMTDLRDSASRAQSNLLAGQQIIREIQQWKSSPGRAAANIADETQLRAALTQAATAAGLTDPPTYEPDKTKPIEKTDYSETPFYLGFKPLTLRQLTIFLHDLAQRVPSARAIDIELSPPAQSASATPTDELWTADVTIGCLTYTPNSAARANGKK